MDFNMDLHIHTNLSSDSSNKIEDVVAGAKKKRLKVLGITNHIPELPDYIRYKEIDALYSLKEKAKELEKKSKIKIPISSVLKLQ